MSYIKIIIIFFPPLPYFFPSRIPGCYRIVIEERFKHNNLMISNPISHGDDNTVIITSTRFSSATFDIIPLSLYVFFCQVDNSLASSYVTTTMFGRYGVFYRTASVLSIFDTLWDTGSTNFDRYY